MVKYIVMLALLILMGCDAADTEACFRDVRALYPEAYITDKPYYFVVVDNGEKYLVRTGCAFTTRITRKWRIVVHERERIVIAHEDITKLEKVDQIRKRSTREDSVPNRESTDRWEGYFQ